MPLSATIIINASAGTQDKPEISQHLAESFAAHGFEVRIRVAANGGEIAGLARQARLDESRIVVVAGGDGTINAVASALVGTDKVLGVIPRGTFNYFARNLKIPLDLEGAVRTIVEGHVVAINVGEVNSRPFLNNSSVGIYPSILKQREKSYRRYGRSRLAGYLSAALTILRRSHFLRVRLSADDKEMACRTPLIFVGNNDYQLEYFNLGGSECLKAGELSLLIIRAVGRLEMFWLALRTLCGFLQSAKDLRVICAEDVWVETHRDHLQVAIDGEVVLLETPLHFRVLPRALRVIVPIATDSE